MTTQSPMEPSSSLSAEFWEQRYQSGTPRWDLGKPAPPIVEWFSASDAPSSGRIAVLGCGMGHEALFLAGKGFEVTAVDFAPSAIAIVSQRARDADVPITCLQRNIFDLIPDYAHQFDYVLEHTCFCALDPSLRSAYVDLAADLLKPQGHLLALFFTHSRPGGPPFGSDPKHLKELFQQRFEILSFTQATHSIPSRRNEEHLGYFRKK